MPFYGIILCYFYLAKKKRKKKCWLNIAKTSYHNFICIFSLWKSEKKRVNSHSPESLWTWFSRFLFHYKFHWVTNKEWVTSVTSWKTSLWYTINQRNNYLLFNGKLSLCLCLCVFVSASTFRSTAKAIRSTFYWFYTGSSVYPSNRILNCHPE